jgi:hypothetical protein
MAGSSEHDNKSWISTKGGIFLDQMSDYYIIKNVLHAGNSTISLVICLISLLFSTTDLRNYIPLWH